MYHDGCVVPLQVAWQGVSQGGKAIAATSEQAVLSAIYNADGHMMATEPAKRSHHSHRHQDHHKPPSKDYYEGHDDEQYKQQHDDYMSYDRPYDAEQHKLIEVVASSDTYARSDMCGIIANSVGWIEPGFTNYALFRDLKPNTRYFYAVRNSQVRHSWCRGCCNKIAASATCTCV